MKALILAAVTVLSSFAWADIGQYKCTATNDRGDVLTLNWCTTYTEVGSETVVDCKEQGDGFVHIKELKINDEVDTTDINTANRLSSYDDGPKDNQVVMQLDKGATLDLAHDPDKDENSVTVNTIWIKGTFKNLTCKSELVD